MGAHKHWHHGFWFVVMKFSMFVKQLSPMLELDDTPEIATTHAHYSSIIGIVLVVLGVVAVIMSYVTYRITNKQLAAGVYQAFIVVYQSAYQFNFLIEHAVGVLSDQNNIAEVKFHGTTNNLYDLLLVTCVVFASLTLLVYR